MPTAIRSGATATSTRISFRRSLPWDTRSNCSNSFDRRGYPDFADLNQRLLGRVIAFKPDVIFCVLMNYEVWSETLDIIRAHSPAVVVNWGTDNSWKYDQVSRFLIPHLDFHVTTDKNTAVRAASAGFGNVVLSQWAASRTQLLEPLPSSQCVHDVSFIGNLYGDRRTWIEGLRARGVKVATFGHGSDGGVVAASDIPEIYRKSRISLNFSDSGLHLAGVRLKRSRQIKARVFEVPGAGGVLLTQTVNGLSDYFRVGDEIDTFDRLDDLAAKITAYLSNPAARDRMAIAGHRRVVAEHTYDHRFRNLLEHVQAHGAPERKQLRWQIDPRSIAETSRPASQDKKHQAASCGCRGRDTRFPWPGKERTKRTTHCIRGVLAVGRRADIWRSRPAGSIIFS